MSSVINNETNIGDEITKGIVLNKANLVVKGNTVIDINNYKKDKVVSKGGKLILKSEEKYLYFNIPSLNKINDTVYDSLEKLIYTKKI